ncbi:hypothetical protein Droror1_Dr00003379 [Drosera rotundifolia]
MLEKLSNRKINWTEPGLFLATPAPFPSLLPPPPFSFICFPFSRQSSRARLDDHGDSETVTGITELNLTDGPSNGESAAVEGEVLGGDVEEVLDSNRLKFLGVLVDLVCRFWVEC